MIEVFSSSCVLEDSTSVVDELLSDCDSAGNWPSFIDLIDHILLSLDFAVFLDSVDLGSLLCPASFIGQAVLALDLGRATHPIVVAVSLVRRASLISNIVVEDPFIAKPCVSTITSIVLHIA